VVQVALGFLVVEVISLLFSIVAYLSKDLLLRADLFFTLVQRGMTDYLNKVNSEVFK
jgi:hypothetical protein